MILRSITQHIKDQNWFAVVLDFLIVVVGVFVGLQVSNWNAGLADHARAQAYLERISRDIESDITNAETKIKFWSQVVIFGETGLSFAETGNANGMSQWGLLQAYFNASQVNEFYLSEITYQEMKSAGELVLIKNPALRESLGLYYSLGSNVSLSERPRFREHVRGVIPLKIQSYMWSSCFESTDFGVQRFISCEPIFSEAEIAAVVKKISDNDVLMEELRYWMSTLKIASMIGNNSVASAKRVESLIDSELAE
jgi:hypothetical protein